MNETPSKGGSYVREKDGKLKRVASTAPAPDRDLKPKAKKTGGKLKGKDHA